MFLYKSPQVFYDVLFTEKKSIRLYEGQESQRYSQAPSHIKFNGILLGLRNLCEQTGR